MTYTVKYKTGLFWKTLKRVKADGILEHGQSRYFILEDESRVEVPISARFKFDRERFLAIKNNMQRETGQPVHVCG